MTSAEVKPKLDWAGPQWLALWLLKTVVSLLPSDVPVRPPTPSKRALRPRGRDRVVRVAAGLAVEAVDDALATEVRLVVGTEGGGQIGGEVVAADHHALHRSWPAGRRSSG